MKYIKNLLLSSIFIILLSPCFIFGANQTPTLSPVLINANLPKNKQLPFQIKIEQIDFQLPVGIQTGASGVYKNKWLFLAGRINGLHGFDSSNNNFPKNKQNFDIYVVDINEKTVESRSLHDPQSGLTKEQIETLAVTAPQYYQNGNTLYMTGGYGADNTGSFSTKPILTAMNVPGLMDWVINKNTSQTASQFIRQISNPIFKVTGGIMNQVGNNPTLLMLGQNFQGPYNDTSNGIYTEQVRKFFIIDDGVNLSVNILPPSTPDENYRRRDLNIVPIVKKVNNQNVFGYVALAGVFTPGSGIWTVPIEITSDGIPSMADPNLDSTFKQGMNIYRSSTLRMFSDVNKQMYIVIFGGITFESYTNGQFVTDSEIPFTNQVTVVKIDKDNKYNQYLLNTTFPIIQSHGTNPGNTLLFGTGSCFIPATNLLSYENGVFDLDYLENKQTTVGYIVGGIQSTVPNTTSQLDSAASPYIFRVSITAQGTCIPNVKVDDLTEAIRKKYL